MQLRNSSPGRLIGAAAIAGAAALMPAAAFAAAGQPATTAGRAQPLTAWVGSGSSYAVTLINTATNKVSNVITVGEGPGLIAISQHRKTAYVAIEFGCH